MKPTLYILLSTVLLLSCSQANQFSPELPSQYRQYEPFRNENRIKEIRVKINGEYKKVPNWNFTPFLVRQGQPLEIETFDPYPSIGIIPINQSKIDLTYNNADLFTSTKITIEAKVPETVVYLNFKLVESDSK